MYKQLDLSIEEPKDEVRYDNLLMEPETLRKEVEFANVQRVFEESKAFAFSAPNKITSPRDVAYIFKQLETAAVENAFAVLVKDGRPTVIHLGMGSTRACTVSTDSVIAADKKINADKIWLVHNHPSGNVYASREDMALLNRWEQVFGNRMQPGIIINTRTGLFGEFCVNGEHEKSELTIEPGRTQYPVKLYSFSKLVFNKDYKETGIMNSSSAVAAFLSGQRLGERTKLSYLILGQDGTIQANIHTNHSSIHRENVKDLARQIADDTIIFGGRMVITYGTASVDRLQVKKLQDRLKQKEVLMQDHISVKVDVDNLGNSLDRLYKYQSASDEGWLNSVREQEMEYGWKKTDKPIQGLNSHTREDIKSVVKHHIENVLQEADIDAEIIDLDIHGSRGRGDAREDSDLDVVVEYNGDIKEDGMFNTLNGEPLHIEGIKVDINPIRAQETGKLQQYMARSKEYDAAKRAANYSQEEEEIKQKAMAAGSFMKAPNGAQTMLTEKQWLQVRTQAFKNWFGDWEKAARIERLRESKNVDVEFDDEYQLDRESAKAWIKAKIKKDYTNKDTGEKILVSNVGIDKVTSHGEREIAHLKSLKSIPRLIEESIFITEEKNEKENDKYDSYRYYVCGVDIDKEEYTAKIVVGVKNGVRYYDHELSQIKKGALIAGLNEIAKPVAEKQNTFFDTKDKRLLSILQTDASMGIDINGEPLVVHHGTAEEFNTFQSKNGTYWFARESDYAEAMAEERGGARVIDAYLNMKNPYHAVLVPGMFNDPNFEASIIQSARQRGHDGVILQANTDNDLLANTSYIVFNPSQIKSAKENVGAFSVENEDIRFRFIGEKGAARLDQAEATTTRLDNLAVAWEMEAAKKDARTIKMATGWERGADGKWRYETPDFEYRPLGDANKDAVLKKQPWYDEFISLLDRTINGEELSEEEGKRFGELSDAAAEIKKSEELTDKIYLDDYVKDESLFKAYPEMKTTTVVFGSYPNEDFAGTFNDSENKIVVNLDRANDVRSVLAHEIQHAIQRIEGFAQGGSTEQFVEENQKWIEELNRRKGEIEEEMERGDMDREEELKEIEIELFDLTEDAPYHKYRSLSGEVESRNVQSRIDMTPEQRRASLASETEDVARDKQIMIEAREQVRDLSAKLHTPIRVIKSDDIHHSDKDMEKRMRAGKGWYNTRTGEVALVLDNQSSMEDLKKTVLHEVVGHKGLREIMGEKTFKTMCESVYRSMNPAVQQSYLQQYGTPAIAGEEFIAHAAEHGTTVSMWQSITSAFKVALNSIGIHVNYSYKEVAALLKRSHRHLENKRAPMQPSVSAGIREDRINRGIMTEEEYLGLKGYSAMGYAEPALHKGRQKTQRAQDRVVQNYHERAKAYDEERSRLRQEYREKVGRGELRAPTPAEEVIELANGNPESEATQAARRSAEKRGIDWRVQKEEKIADVNRRFNQELQLQINGELPKGHIYRLGRPSQTLKGAGIPDLPIEMVASRLSDKSMQDNHPFDLSEVQNLVTAIQNPLAVFRSATHIGSNVILTELNHQGKNFVVAIQTNKKKGRIEINDIRSLYPKNSMAIVNWIEDGLADYLDKKRMAEWLSKQRSNSAEVRKLFDHAAKLVQSFENAKEEQDIRFRFIGETSGVKKQTAKPRKRGIRM